MNPVNNGGKPFVFVFVFWTALLFRFFLHIYTVSPISEVSDFPFFRMLLAIHSPVLSCHVQLLFRSVLFCSGLFWSVPVSRTFTLTAKNGLSTDGI